LVAWSVHGASPPPSPPSCFAPKLAIEVASQRQARRPGRAAIHIQATAPEIDPQSVLAGAQFVDAFSTVIDDTTLDAPLAAHRMVGRSPAWVTALMALRDLIVRPLGLKTSQDAAPGTERIGIFPVLTRSPERVVVGLDDRHLDFCAIVDVSPQGESRRVTLTTVVRTHNLLGRTYLAAILPFHRIVVRSMLRQVAKA
jgi:hypothetical protein